MARTLLSLVRQACSEIGIPQPGSLIGSQDDQAQQLLSLANREGSEFATRANSKGGWQELHKEYSFYTVANQSAYDLPFDFSYFVERTFWDGAYRWELLGPISAQQKQVLKYGYVNDGPRVKFYVRANKLYLIPTPTTNTELIAYDYYSNAWCYSPLGVAQTTWQSDEDTYALNEDAFIMGIKWRFLRAKGLDYAQEEIDYNELADRAMGRSGDAPDLALGYGAPGFRLIDYDNVQDGNFPG